MTKSIIVHKVYFELEKNLAVSSSPQRHRWAKTIVDEQMDLIQIALLLRGERKAAMRLLWLISDIGLYDASYLFKALPELFAYCKDLPDYYRESFASWWRIAGVPEESESDAIDHCFHMMKSVTATPTNKLRAAEVLMKLTKKYPDLRAEVVMCIEANEDRYSADFLKRSRRLIISY